MGVIKHYIAKILPPRIYWTLAGLVNPYSAAISGQKKRAAFYPLGNYEVELFKKLGVLEKYAKTLEVGCGPGRIQWALSKCGMNLEVHGTDFSPSMIRLARANVPTAIFAVGNGKDLSHYENNSFNLIYSFVVFQHVDEEIFHGYVREANRVLKPNGFLIFQIQSSEGMIGYERPRGHPWLLRHYTREEINEILKRAGFSSLRILNMKGEPNPTAVDESGFLFVCSR